MSIFIAGLFRVRQGSSRFAHRLTLDFPTPKRAETFSKLRSSRSFISNTLRRKSIEYVMPPTILILSCSSYIDHFLLAEQLRTLLPAETELHRLLWDFLRRTVELGGNIEDKEKGLPLGASLSPLLGAVYLSPLDELGGYLSDGFYSRYMDDWIMVLPKRHALRKTVRANYKIKPAFSG